MWSSQLANKRLLYYSDNKSVVQIINNKTTMDRELLALLRQLVLVCLKHNIYLRAHQVRGKNNGPASTVLTFVLAIGYVHRILSFPDPTRSDVIKLALKGYAKCSPSRDNRLPIMLPTLERILCAFLILRYPHTPSVN